MTHTHENESPLRRELAHDRFGGTKPGAVFFGWMVAVGMTVLLGAIATAVGAAVGAGASYLTEPTMVGITSAVVALAVLMIAYFAGGYVAGRLARFDGRRNGMAVWLLGVIVTALVAAAAAIAGPRFEALRSDLIGSVPAPAVPLTADQMTVGGIVALVAVLLATLIAATVGGAAGERFHRRVDRTI